MSINNLTERTKGKMESDICYLPLRYLSILPSIQELLYTWQYLVAMIRVILILSVQRNWIARFVTSLLKFLNGQINNFGNYNNSTQISTTFKNNFRISLVDWYNSCQSIRMKNTTAFITPWVKGMFWYH